MKKLCSYLDHAVETLIVLIFILMVGVGCMQVFNRFALNSSLSWSEEFQKYSHIWLVFLAIPVGYRRGAHIGVSHFVSKLPVKAQFALIMVVDTAWLIFAGCVAVLTTVIMGVAKEQVSAGLGIRMDRIYLALLIGSVYLIIVVIRQSIEHIQHFRTGRLIGAGE